MINYGFPFGYFTDGYNLQVLQFGLPIRNPVLLFEDEVEKTHQQREVFCPQALNEFFERNLQCTAFMMMEQALLP